MKNHYFFFNISVTMQQCRKIVHSLLLDVSRVKNPRKSFFVKDVRYPDYD